MSSFVGSVPLNWESGGLRSEWPKLTRSGQTRLLESPFDSAPASKRTQGDVMFSRVRQRIPTLVSASCVAMSPNQREPLSISSVEIQVFVPWSTSSIHVPSKRATCLLRSPDQLIKTFIGGA